jgi:hypothetical protein
MQLLLKKQIIENQGFKQDLNERILHDFMQKKIQNRSWYQHFKSKTGSVPTDIGCSENR